MLLVLGLGNPGPKYERTRHNVGFLAVESCAAFFQLRLKKRCFRLYRRATVGDRALLVQPLTYMNKSGDVLKHFSPSSMVVVCDQMDLPAGTIRLKKGGSSAGHRGLASLMEHTGDGNFIRIYIGIGRPNGEEGVIDHVLGAIDDEAIYDGIGLAAKALVSLIEGASFEEVANGYNRRPGTQLP
ncbi:MAG: aminoacyl-tRNA hydrolase [Sphaerochaeta sp.]|jgi:PTH1 family peptidyl-tRNA hydrolase|nr:aminoacyl-tRNA hydrolase [Sphaerochaeta sp.]